MWSTSMSWKIALMLALLTGAVGVWNLFTDDILAGVFFLLAATAYLVTALLRVKKKQVPSDQASGNAGDQPL